MLNNVKKIGDFSINEYSNFQLISAQELYVHGLSAYAISARGRRKINDIYTNSIKNEPKEPIDLLLKRCISSGIISASVVFPFVTGIDFDSKSQMEGRQASDNAKLYDAAANLFVADYSLINQLEDFSLDINRSSFVNRLNNIASKLAMKNFYS